MQSFTELITAATPYIPLIQAITGTGVILSLPFTGLIPRIGPGRAAWIALRSRLISSKNPQSIRTADIKRLTEAIQSNCFAQKYIVVTGPKGVGKSCLVDTVTNSTFQTYNH